MNRKSKATWFFIGLASGWMPIVVVTVVMLVWVDRTQEQDPFGGIRPDMGENIHKFGRPSTGTATVLPLGNGPFIATVGPSRYQDEDNDEWDFYTISVQKQQGKHSYVLFEREFRMADVPTGIVTKEARDIASLDKESQVVTFVIGRTTHTYKLPDR